MVPAFLGDHYLIDCADCGISFSVDAENIPDHQEATCPNCGFQGNSYQNLKRQPATPITLNTNFDDLARWDVVAFQFSGSTKYGVKRIVGLPGESIQIRNGDVWVNGILASRDWATKNQMKILSFDSEFLRESKSGDVERLIFQGLWKKNGMTFRLDSNEKGSAWVFYQPIISFRGAENRMPTPLIRDNYAFNQSNSRSKLNSVDQLLVELELNVAAGNRVALFIPQVDRVVGFWLNTSDNCVSIYDENQLLANSSFSATNGWFKLSVSTIDDDLQLFIDDQLVCESLGTSLGNLIDGVPQLPEKFVGKYPVCLYGDAGIMGGSLKVRGLKIFRDVFYTDRGEGNFQLKEDEFLVLGDNSPVSVDSRTWAKSEIARDQIIGKVKGTSSGQN